MKLPTLTFRLLYFLIAMLLFATEVIIALYFKDGFIRPLLGDFLVVILIYSFFRAFLVANKLRLALAVLALAYAIETLQYLNIMGLLGLKHNTLTRMVLGTTFTWEDILAYTLGIGCVLLVEYLRDRKNPKPQDS